MSTRFIQIQVPKNIGNVLASQFLGAATASLQTTMQAVKSKWESVAQQRLVTTRNDYILGLNADDSLQFPDDFTAVLTLRGKWPNMLESGFGPFDMKDPGFRNSVHAKPRKDGTGWYLTIPFRHRTPGTVGSAVGGQAMPADIYAQARVLMAGQRLTGTEFNYPPGVSWTGYQHKNGIYEGMVRNVKTYDKATQSTYFTFRRVSDRSDPDSWMHPGFPGIQAVDVVEPYAKDTFKKVFQANIKKIMG